MPRREYRAAEITRRTEVRLPGSLKGWVLVVVVANLLAACGSAGSDTPGSASSGAPSSAGSHAPATPLSLLVQSGARQIWSCAFQTSTTNCDFTEHGADLTLNQQATGCEVGREQWWEHSLGFPVGAQASGQEVVAFGSPPNYAMFYGGWPGPGSGRAEIIKAVVSETRYDLTYHVVWSAGNDGLFEVWVGDTQVMSYKGRTLFDGCGLKIANYRSVIHDRVIRYDVN